jgi:phage/plasmid-associated DNA primase
MANMLQYQQWDEHIQEITWHKPVIVTTADDNDVEDLMNVDGPIAESTPSVEMLLRSVPQDRLRLSHLNKEQCRAHNIIENHLLAHLDGRKPPQLLMLILGQGRTGKSTLIRPITKTFDEWKVSQLLCKMATTGVVASLISGTILDSWGASQ